MIHRGRALVPLIAISFCFSVVAARLFFLQVWNHQELERRVNRLVCKERPEQACRGTIFDRNGKVLAMSIRNYTVFVDPKMIGNVRELSTKLAGEHIRVPANIAARASHTSFVPLSDDVDDAAMRRLKSERIAGVGFIPHYDRKYPEGAMACHVLGAVGKENGGLDGVELSANPYLTGEKIREVRYRDGRGREIPEKLRDTEGFRGGDIYLTIDRNLQFIAEQELDQACEKYRPQKAMIVMQDPNTGEILAMASRPAYTPGDLTGDARSMRNPAVSDIFEPGSTFKMITAAAALEEKLASRAETIWCENGRYAVFNHTIKDHEKKGFLTFDQVFEYSSNIGTAKISQRLGKEKLYQYARQFGFYAETGVDLPGEARGLLREPARWDGLSLPTISFGQGIGVTALQVINAFSCLVNGGTLYEPRVTREVRSPLGEVIHTAEPRVIRRSISPEVSAQIRDILVGVVENGTGAAAKVPNYSVGGKTGTAQKRDPETKRYSRTAYVASFCGAIPMNDPRLTILVILDEPKGDYWGSSVATPVFGRIASRAVSYLRIPPDRKPICLVKTTVTGKMTH